MVMINTVDDQQLIASGQRVFAVEQTELTHVSARLGHNFARACRLLLNLKGRVVTTGMGKSGHIARKIAATLASTGTPAFFVHPGEAAHGDLGMITEADAVLALSHSGESEEVLRLLPIWARQGNPLIALTGHEKSTLARAASVHLDTGVRQEACSLALAPTSSTTAALVMGDALAVALLDARGFTADDFARSHPAGTLGRRLLLRIADIMHTGDAIPRVPEHASISTALLEMSRKRLGMTAIVDADNHLLGLFTDGDLRRTLDTDLDLRNATIAEVMTPRPRTIHADQLAVEAARVLEKHQINGLMVVDATQCVIGALNLHDLLRAKVV